MKSSKEAKRQIEIINVAIDHKLFRDRWLNIKRILDAIYKELSPLIDGQQAISISKNSLPIEQRKLFQSVLERMLKDGVADYYNHKQKMPIVVVTSDSLRKFLRGEDVIIKNRNIFENYRKEISELCDLVEKDGKKKFPETYKETFDKEDNDSSTNKKNKPKWWEKTWVQVLMFLGALAGIMGFILNLTKKDV